MKTYIALLRGINISGQKTIRMTDLKSCLGELGWEGIRTYVQSGNIIFKSADGHPGHLAGKISQKLLDKYDFNVPTLVLEPGDLLYIINHNPYAVDPDIVRERLYVTFLFDAPREDLVMELQNTKPSNEHFIIHDQVIFLYYPDGYGRARMDNNAFERTLKVEATTRNWKTVNKLYELVQQ